jgi:hypothetical protein
MLSVPSALLTPLYEPMYVFLLPVVQNDPANDPTKTLFSPVEF